MNNYLQGQFGSKSNKGLIWSLLIENGTFTNIPEQKASMVKEMFDKQIDNIANKIVPSDNLINLNKVVISTMIREIESYKNNINNNIGQMDNIYNASELSQQRQKIFDNELSNKKLEFDNLNNTSVPDKIDFSDDLDSPIGSEMDKILQAQIALREKQLNNVLNTQDKEGATKWINPSGQSQNDIEQTKLKIGDDISLDINELDKVKKRVYFEDEKPQQPAPAPAPALSESNDFMALLKRKSTNPIQKTEAIQTQEILSETTSVSEMLKEILDKQNQILNLLTKQE